MDRSLDISAITKPDLVGKALVQYLKSNLAVLAELKAEEHEIYIAKPYVDLYHTTLEVLISTPELCGSEGSDYRNQLDKAFYDFIAEIENIKLFTDVVGVQNINPIHMLGNPEALIFLQRPFHTQLDVDMDFELTCELFKETIETLSGEYEEYEDFCIVRDIEIFHLRQVLHSFQASYPSAHQPSPFAFAELGKDFDIALDLVIHKESGKVSLELIEATLPNGLFCKENILFTTVARVMGGEFKDNEEGEPTLVWADSPWS